MNKYKVLDANGVTHEYIDIGPHGQKPEWAIPFTRLAPEDLDAPAKAARKAIIKAAKSANSVAALRALVLVLAEDLGHEIDP